MDILLKFKEKLPLVREWVDETVAQYQNEARTTSSYSLRNLSQYFLEETLSSAKIVEMDKVPVPPLSSIGISELVNFEKDPKEYDGITLLNTCFLRKVAAKRPELHFHELVHIVQWQILGVDTFLMVYGIGLLKFGYWKSPLEVMARKYTDLFQENEPVFNVETLVRSEVNELLALLKL
ncbi:MAG: hypothetical protein K8F52_16915 [Candidatus Scalindua rubra]|uniref:DUF4157 domain-containing protein n=1 Tax=Candidatus Scalindua brodae TaxID=237368 RepID=A0A0B0EHY7_9BACT|nr:MAG: hypothetical protein SCABRO_03980 [Candidatus Scalindua brodae]MBZ0110333.1 hypothetical protein [Candidatus Scalindua rubra]TWU30632.1 hypothetical protein S225a_24990 [Candidatus Brocadiaceae bacterium S225]